MASPAQHSTYRQLTKRLVQVAAFSVACLVSLPSFAQGPICLGGYWNGSACIFSSNPPNNNPWGGSGSSATTPHPWSYTCAGFNCDSADDYYDDDSYDDPEQCFSTKSNASDCEKKEKYCEQLGALNGLLNGLLSANNITGTASTGYSIAQGSAGIAYDVIQSAYNDIRHYYQSSGTMHLSFSYTSGVIDWYEASIDWDISGYVEFGAEHVFATWVHSVGQGNESSVLRDPDPGTSCP